VGEFVIHLTGSSAPVGEFKPGDVITFSGNAMKWIIADAMEQTPRPTKQQRLKRNKRKAQRIARKVTRKAHRK
jgi:hypothetical protein